jgi:two-component system sensor histidine kinase EvgS
LKGTFIDANKAAEEILGYSKSEVLGKSFLKLSILPKKEILRAGKLLARNLAGKPTGPDEFTLIRKDGTKVPVEIRTHPVKIDNSTYVLGIARDISAKKVAEEELIVAKKAAEAASIAKSQFLANMSHEIRTPMNAILGFSEILREELKDPKYTKYTDTIITSGNTLLALINDILDLSKIEAGKIDFQYRPVDPHELFNDIARIFSVKIKDKGLKLLTDIDEKLPKSLLLDEVRMRQILFNLVGNAVKFTDEGYIELKVKGVFYPDRSKIDLIFSVKDTGIGISQEDKKIIFDAFKQSSGLSVKKYGGTGLGLSITKRLVEMMNGEISVESIVGKGSTFAVKMKEVSVASVDSGIEEEKLLNEDIKFNNQKVLIVDDIESNRLLLNEILTLYGLRVIEAVNGKEAINMAKSKNPDVILMDLRMPVMDGYEAIKILKNDSRLKRIPVIVLTASAMKSTEEDIKKINCEGYIRKPVRRQELISEIKKYLRFETKFEDKATDVSSGQQPVLGNKEDKHKKVTNLSAELKDRLENEFYNEYLKVKREFIINDIEEFAAKMTEFAGESDLEAIYQWGKKLSRQANNFDLENLASTLDEFEGIVRKIKSS